MRPELDWSELMAIFLGGALGTLARVGLSLAFPAANGSWPWAVFAINIAGAFALGWLVTHLHPSRHPFAGPGFCGAFTTFSTLQFELFEMLRHHRPGLALLYASATVVLGYGAVRAAVRLTGRWAP
jgi:CrcB protein